MGATFALGATTFVPGPRLPVLGGFPAEMPRFAPSCAGADCGDPLPGVDPRSWAVSRRVPPLSQAPHPSTFWVVLQENGPELDVPPGFWVVFQFLAAIRVDGSGITLGQEYPRCRRPVSQPTKPPRTCLGVSCEIF